MSTVLVSVAPCRTADVLLDTVESFGEVRTASVDAAGVLHAIVHMIALRANVSIRVIELTPEKIVLSYEYDMSGMFKMAPLSNAGGHYWLYTVEANPDEQDGDIYTIVETVYALCNTNRDVCSRKVAQQIAAKVNDASRWENENLRAALEYYGTLHAWRGPELVSDYNRDILDGKPWRTAYDALMNRRVTPLPEAVERAIADRKRRGQALPDFLAN